MTLLHHAVSLLNRVGCRLKAWIYARGIRHSRISPIPVISVGNIALGGSEKTPLVLDILSRLLRMGFRPAMISRGYKGSLEKGGGVVSDGRTIRSGWREAGDEPYMAAVRLPDVGVFVGRNRLASCRTAAEHGFDLAVLDDGFQHLQLHRDVDIVLYDPSPKKPLRESHSALKRADILLVKNSESTDIQAGLSICQNNPQAAFSYHVVFDGFFQNTQSEKGKFSMLPEKKCMAVCAIAAPERFFELLSHTGITPEAVLAFPDHWSYPPSSLKKIKNIWEKSGADYLVTTEKDFAKLKGQTSLQDIPLYFARVGVVPEQGFYAELEERVIHAKNKI